MAKDKEKKEIVFSSYKGPSGIARDSVWMTADDLPEDQDITVKVIDVLVARDVEFEQGRKEDTVMALKFEGRKRVLKLNATNRKVMNKLFGRDTTAWFDKSITLTVAEVMSFGETIDAVRIRSRGVKDRTVKAAEQVLSEPAASSPDLQLVNGSVMAQFKLDPAMEPTDFKERATKAALALVGEKGKGWTPERQETEVNRLVEMAEKERIAG